MDFGKLDENGDEFSEGTILRIIIPGENWHRTFWLEHICTWRVIKNYCIFHMSSNFGHIFCKYPINVGTVLSEESHRAKSVGIHLVHKWIRIFWKTCCENYYFIVLCHNFKEVVNSWSLLHKNVADTSFDIDRNYVIWILNLLKLAVHQRLI